MAQTAANVRVGRPLTTGGILRAPTGTAMPTDSTTALNGSFVAVGYISDDGVTMTTDTDVTDIKAWGADIVRKIQTSHDVSFKFTMIETSAASTGVFFDDANVTGTTSLTILVKSGDLTRQEWILEIRDGAKKFRVVVPDGNITERGDITFKDDEAIGYEVTLTSYPDSSGNKAYIYTS